MKEQASILTPESMLHHLDWHVIRRLDGLLQGNYRSLFYGVGIDFADLREYQPEDDVRYIDWNVTARMDFPYVRQYVEDREITAWFLLDLSPSIDFGSKDIDKRSVLVNFVGLLSRLLTRQGNRVGAVIYSDRIEKMIPPRGGRIQVLRLMNDLLKQPTISGAPFTDLSPLLMRCGQVLKKRSLVFIISDFLCLPGWEKPFTVLSQKHEVIAVRLWDPSEMAFPELGVMIVEDAETGEQIYVDTNDRSFRTQFHAAVEDHKNGLMGTFKRAGVDFLTLSTQDDLVRVIVKFAKLRKQRRKRR
jgi:uncharacterized protein (DUF58 family)